MIPMPIFWAKQYTATAQGSRLKFVPCEHCSVEYVYVIEREATGAGVSVYTLNNQGATDKASVEAGLMLSDILENDFDPVPCPVCGHYQRYMFPKLLGNTGAWVRLVLLVVLALGCLTGVIAAYRSISYLLRPADDGFGQLVAAWVVLLLLGVAGFGLSSINKVLIRRFNPNVDDPQARIAIGRSRAITREEFEKAQPAKSPACSMEETRTTPQLPRSDLAR